MRSEVTAEVLEKVAKRLGRDYAVKKDLEGRDWFCRFMMKAVDAYRALSQEPRNG